MPLVVYTEDELIEASNKAAADACAVLSEQRDRAEQALVKTQRRVQEIYGYMKIDAERNAANEPGVYGPYLAMLAELLPTIP